MHADHAQRVTDYLAGMTDRYCIRAYTALAVPQVRDAGLTPTLVYRIGRVF